MTAPSPTPDPFVGFDDDFKAILGAANDNFTGIAAHIKSLLDGTDFKIPHDSSESVAWISGPPDEIEPPPGSQQTNIYVDLNRLRSPKGDFDVEILFRKGVNYY